MGFASFSTSSDSPGRELKGSGPPVFILQGQAFHGISTALPSDGKKPRYGQLYFYDPIEASAKRKDWFDGLSEHTYIQLHTMLLNLDTEGNSNPYARGYLHLKDKLGDQEQQGIKLTAALRFTSGTTPDPRRYPVFRQINHMEIKA